MRKVGHWTPRYVINRAVAYMHARAAPDAPWLTHQAVAFLEQYLSSGDRVLEWGSGRSTLWFARRTAHVVSVEHDRQWAQRVQLQLRAAALGNVDYLLAPIDDFSHPDQTQTAAYINGPLDHVADGSLDVGLVDGLSSTRGRCALALLRKLRSGALLIVDNANRYLASASPAPESRGANAPPLDESWRRFGEQVRGWRHWWTSDGVTDTAFWFVPAQGDVAHP